MTAGAKFTVESSRVQISGNFAYVMVVAIANQQYGNQDIVATIPDEYRPIRSSPLVSTTLYRGAVIPGIFAGSGYVHTNGNVYIDFTSSSGQVDDKLILFGIYSV